MRFRYREWGGLGPDARAFMVPVEALVFGPNEETSVFVFDPESSTVRRTAVRLAGSEAKQVAVIAGLEEGSIIATAGASFLRDGQKVVLMAADEFAGTRS